MTLPAAQPRLIILAGPNGSGKTTFATQLMEHQWGQGCRFLNADELAERLGGWNDVANIAQAQQLIRADLQGAIQARDDIMYETVFSHPSKLDLIRQAREAGYFIRLFFVCTESPRINIDRVAERFAKGGHGVPGDKVNSRYHRALMYGAEALRMVQRGYVYDNTKSAAVNDQTYDLLFRTIKGQSIKLYSNPETWSQTYQYFLHDLLTGEEERDLK